MMGNEKQQESKLITKDQIITMLEEQGRDPNDYQITIIDDTTYKVEPISELYIILQARAEDEKVKSKVAMDAALSAYELMQVSEGSRKKLELEQAAANLEVLMLMGNLNKKIDEMNELIQGIKGR